MEEGLKNLEKHDNHVDIVLTHTCPGSIFDKLSKIVGNGHDAYYKHEIEVSLRKYLDTIKDNVKFDSWFFGHFHEDVLGIDNKFYALYEKIVTIN